MTTDPRSARHAIRPMIRTACLAAGLAAILPARAHGHGDPFILEYRSATNQLTVTPGIYDVFNVDENLATPGFGLPISTIYPGFSRGDGLPAGTAVSLRFIAPLRYWSPTTGPLDPLPTASGRIDVVNRSAATASIGAAGVGGTNPLFLDTFVGHPGEHHHLTAYELDTPDPAGLYGLWAEASATGPGYPGGGTNPSAPFLIVLNWGIEDESQYHEGVTRLSVLPDPSIRITVSNGVQTQTQAGHPFLSGADPVVKAGGGTLVIDQVNPLTGPTRIEQGTLRLGRGAALTTSRIVPLAGGTLALAPALEATVAGLEVDAGGLVDVGSGMLTVRAGIPVAELTAALRSGRAAGSWNGTAGVTSSVAAADVAGGVPRAVGWLADADGGVRLAYAAPGDTNLDGEVNVFDLVGVNSSNTYGTGTASVWSQGDFDYNGVTNVFDMVLTNVAGVYGTGHYRPSPPAATNLHAVPEPAALLTACGWLVWLGSWARRRRGVRDRPPAPAGTRHGPPEGASRAATAMAAVSTRST